MANLAEGIQGLVQHMRAEQQMIRDWVEAQAAREKELKQILERLAPRADHAETMVAASARHRREPRLNYWPGFVDALSTMLLAIIFLLSVFMLGAVLPRPGDHHQGDRRSSGSTARSPS